MTISINCAIKIIYTGAKSIDLRHTAIIWRDYPCVIKENWNNAIDFRALFKNIGITTFMIFLVFTHCYVYNDV